MPEGAPLMYDNLVENNQPMENTPILENLAAAAKKNPNMTPEDFVRALQEARMTPEERKIAAAERAGEAFGKIVAGILILLIAPTIIWAVLVFLVGFSVPWVKVFGVFFIFNFVKNLVVNQLKK